MFRTLMFVVATVLFAGCATEKNAVFADDAPLVEEADRSSRHKGEIAFGVPVSDTLHHFEPYHFWTFEAFAGDEVFIDLANRDGLDTYLLLYTWNGTSWTHTESNDDCYDGTYNACIRTELRETTNYLILASTYEYLMWRQTPTVVYDLALHCDNTDDACNGVPLEPQCGSRGMPACELGTYCAFEDNQCGAADVPGTCELIPEICPTIYAPVCGCDGQTYSSECFAARQGVDVSFWGECEVQSEPGWCGGITGETCGANEYCDFGNDSCGAGDQTGTCEPTPDICTMIYAPVCGCDGKTYSNECSAARDGVDVSYVGACQ